MLSLLSGSVALGADFTWDASGGTPLNDGGGAWNATGGTNWFDGTNYGAWGNTSADAATFGVANGAAGTITVGNVTANALTFNAPGSGNYTLSSGTLTLAGTSPTITVNASGTTTIATVLTGSNDWTKSGGGTLFLSNAATTFGITGTTTVNGGVLALNGPLAPNSNGLLGNSAGFVINDGGTIRVESWNALMGYNSGNVRPVTVNAGGLLTMTAGNTAWLRGTLTLAGGTLAGGFAAPWGGWALGNATTTVTENSTISGENVVLSNATANVFDVAAGKTLSVTGNFGFGSDPGSKRDGNLTKSGAGTMTLAGANTYTGTTSVNAGTLQIGGNGTTGSIAATSAVTGSTGAVLAFNRTDNYGGNFSNIISGGLGVTINSGSLTLSAGNSFSGTTTVNAGVLRLGNSNALGALVAGRPVTQVIVNAGGQIDFNGTGATYGYTISGSGATGAGAIVNNGAAITNDSAQMSNLKLAADAAIGGTGNFALLTNSFNPTTLDLAGFTLTKTGNNTITLVNTTATSGTIRIASGTLSQANRDNTLSSVAFTLDNAAGATLALNDRAMTIGSLAGGGATGGGVSLGGNTLTVGGLGTSTTYSGTIDGTGGLVKTGSGTLAFAGGNTYAGTTTASAGTLRLDNNLALQNSVLNTSGGGSLALGTGVTSPTIGGLAGSTNVATAFGNWSQVTALTLNPLSGTATYTGVIANGAAGTTLTKTGSGTQVLQSTSTYTGTTTVNGGVLALNGANTSTGILGNSAGFVINDGGTIRVESWNALMGFDSGNVRPVTVNAGGLLTMSAGNTAWIRGPLTLAGGTLAGGFAAPWGGWNLGHATTTVTENSTISGENVVLSNATANVFDVAAGKTLSVTGNFGFGSDPGSKRNGNLTKSGAGTMTLAGANAYTGTTTIQAGTLQIGNSGTVGSISGSSVITGSAGGTLAFSRTDAYGGTFGNTIGGGIGLALNSGTLTLSGSNTFNGTTKLVAGALTVGNANALQNSTLDMNGADAGSITFSQNSTLGGLSGSRNLDMGTRTLTIGGNGQSTTYSGGLSNGALTKLGSGTLTLSGSNGYTGATAVDAGTLVVNGSLANASLTVASGAALMGSGTIAGLTTIAGMHLPGNSPGVETFTNLTYNSGASVQWELWGNTASNSPTAFDQIIVNGDLTFSGATTLDLVFTGSGGPSSFSSVSWANAFWDSNQEWLLYDVAGAIASANNLALNVTNWQDSTGAFFQTARPGSSFSVEQRDSDVYIVYAAVPEPSTVITACIGIAIAAWSLGRRRPASQGLREGLRDRVAQDTTLPATHS